MADNAEELEMKKIYTKKKSEEIKERREHSSEEEIYLTVPRPRAGASLQARSPTRTSSLRRIFSS